MIPLIIRVLTKLKVFKPRTPNKKHMSAMPQVILSYLCIHYKISKT